MVSDLWVDETDGKCQMHFRVRMTDTTRFQVDQPISRQRYNLFVGYKLDAHRVDLIEKVLHGNTSGLCIRKWIATELLHMKVTKRLLDELRTNAKKCGQSLSQYCISLLSGRHPRAAFSEEELELLRNLKKERADVLLMFNAMIAEFAGLPDAERFRVVINGTDAYRSLTGADIAMMNGGGIRQDIAAGDVTYGDIIKVHPFGNQLCVIKATGQQIIDALEWGVHAVPGEFGGFLQVSGLSYEVDLSVPSGCVTDENGLFVRVDGEYRVKNVCVGNEPIDPNALYTVAGTDYTFINHGDGHTAFDGAELIMDRIKLDNQALLEYIVDKLEGRISDKYADLRGEGRITIVNND